MAVNAQRLAGAPPPPTAEGLLEIARAIRCIQIDAVSAPGSPTQLLVPFSRLGPYDPLLLDRLLFRDRVLFHYFAHAASLVLTEDFPIHRSWMVPYAKRRDTFGVRIASWMAENDRLRRQLVGEITRRGPLRSRDFENTARTDWRSSGWTEGRSVNRMLEFLWVEGVLTVSGRAGGERLWDLAERWFPEWTPRRRLNPLLRLDSSVQLALRALGLGTAGHVRHHFVRGRYDGLAASLQRLTKSGTVLEAEVEGRPGTWYVHRDSIPLLEAAWLPRTVLLSPFDNLIADRGRTSELFGFDYTIEIYVPAAKRRRGYYAMPILDGDRIVGTVDPRLERSTRRLLINSICLEPGESLTPSHLGAMADLATFVGAAEVVRLPASGAS